MKQMKHIQNIQNNQFDSANNTAINDAHLDLGQVGMVALWVGVVSHCFATLAYIVASKRGKETHQIYYSINTIICSVASMCYFLMALRQSDYITTEGHLVLWARYMEFLIGTPLLLIDLCMLIGISKSTMFYVCFMDILMIGSGWFASISTTNTSKWLFFILGCFFFYPILDTVLGITPDPRNPNSQSGHNRFVVLYTAVVWNGYVILWVLHDGFGWVSLDTECVMHTVLDILAKDLFGVVLLYNHDDREMIEIVVSNVDDNSKTVAPSIRRSRTAPPFRSRPQPSRSPVSSDRMLFSSSSTARDDPEIELRPRSPATGERGPASYRSAAFSDDDRTYPRPVSPVEYNDTPDYDEEVEFINARSRSPVIYTGDRLQESERSPRNTLAPPSSSHVPPSPQNVLTRAVQTFERIRQMI